jgi:hypothetical protein
MPFAGYEDFDACTRANSDKGDPDAYCGKIKHQVEDSPKKKRKKKAMKKRANAPFERDSYDYVDPSVRSAIPQHVMHDLWRRDPDAGEHEPTDQDHDRFHAWVRQNYGQAVHDAYFQHEGSRRQGASSLPQIQQTVSPDNAPTPEADVLPEGVMFPIIPERGGQSDEGRPGPPTYPPGAAYAAPGGGDRAKPKAKAKTKTARRRSSMTPSSAAVRMFGRMDAMEGKQPHHKDHYAFSNKAHGQYIRGWNETRGVIDGTLGRTPISKEQYSDWTGRPDLHSHYLGVHSESTARRLQQAGDDSGWESGEDAARNPRIGMRRRAGDSGTGVDPEGRHCSNCGHKPGCDCPHACSYPRKASRRQANGYPMGDMRPAETLPTGEVVGDADHDHWDRGTPNDGTDYGGHPGGEGGATAARRRGQRKRADFMTKPHQSTDDLTPPYNSADTSPDPWSQNEDPGAGDLQAGMRDGQSDAAAGRRPTFMDNSETVSPYVKGYAQGYSGRAPDAKPDTGGHTGVPPDNPDVPRSMGGDSGQAANAQQAATSFQVSKASLRTSAAFVSRGTAASPDFAKGYRFARQWRPGDKLVSRGSAQFEAGLYAGITDSPRTQLAWLTVHASMAGAHPVLGRRLERHRTFTEQLVARGYRSRDNGIYPRSPKPVRRGTAGVSTDLITDGPGTSPDPMGSTPLNGPGTPPPSGGRGDPARSGGPSPYQGAQPMGQGPVVTDDEAGRAQEGPQPAGPLAQGFSGPGPGYGNQDQIPRGGTDLAPAAPNDAAGSGYSNPGAYEGNPSGGDRTARLRAFRTRVQAGLAHTRLAALDDDIHDLLRRRHNEYGQGMHFSTDMGEEEIEDGLQRMGRPASHDDIGSSLQSLQGRGYVWPGHEWATWGLAPHHGARVPA